jgi:hypothetical protein
LALVHPLLALALIVVAGIGVTHLSRPQFLPTLPRVARDDLLATGFPFVLIGILLGPGLGVLDPAGMHVLEPLLALGIGWIGAVFGARLEWRVVRHVPRPIWLMGLALAAPVFGLTTLAAWALAREVPPLATAWQPRWPALLTLAAAATISAGWMGARLARRAALLDTLFAAIVAAVALAIHQPRGMASALLLTVIAAALLGALFAILTRSELAGSTVEAPRAIALVSLILAGAGVAYALRLSPFVLCALATAVIVSLSPAPTARLVDGQLRRWEQPLYALFLIVAGALVRPPTVWLLPAGLLLAAVRISVRWATVRVGGMRAWSPLHGLPPDFGFATARQGAAALAVAAGFDLVRGESAGTLVITVLILILVGEAIVAGSADTPLTAPARQAEVS